MRSRTLPRLGFNRFLLLCGGVLVVLTVTGGSIGAYHSFQWFCVHTLNIANGWLPLFPWIVIVVPLTAVMTGVATIVRQALATHGLVRMLMRDEIGPNQDPLRQAAERADILDRVKLVASPDFFAFCFGWLHPAVCISTTAVAELSPTELEAVLRHESWHLRRRDPLKVLVANGLGSALFLLPVVRDLARHYVLKIELEADHAAIQAMDDAHPLAAALYTAVTRNSTSLLQPAVGAFNSTDARIDQLLGERPPAFQAGALSTAVSVGGCLSLSFLVCLSVMVANLDGIAACVRC